jgi:pimeloyl-ACP methyl ester carboxylesterase
VDRSTAHVVSADGTRVGFERFGSGPPLIAIHGGTADRSRWAPVAESLAQSCTLILVDRRGRGLSADESNEPYDIAKEVDDVGAVIGTLAEPVSLLAHSYGGVIALEAAPSIDRIERMVVYEPAFDTPGLPIFPPGTLARIVGLVEAGDREAALELFFTYVAGVNAQRLEAMRGTPIWQARVAAMHTLTREGKFIERYSFEPARFVAVRTPVRFLVGQESPEPLRASTRTAHAAIKNSELVELPGQGHAAMDTAPELFVREVIDFLTETPATARNERTFTGENQT